MGVCTLNGLPIALHGGSNLWLAIDVDNETVLVSVLTVMQ